jgi:uncharacterized protein (TIGR03086 family)
VARFGVEDAGMDTITDPRPRFRTTLDTARAVVTGVRPDELAVATPCDEYDVRALLEHLLGVLDRVTAVGTGADPFAIPRREVADEGWVAAWDDAAGALWSVWEDDAVLERPSPLPWAPGTAADALVSYVREITLHTWDLATATRQHVSWDEEVLATIAAGFDYLPATGRAEFFAPFKANAPAGVVLDDPFVDAVPVPDDAPMIDRVVAWFGRRP